MTRAPETSTAPAPAQTQTVDVEAVLTRMAAAMRAGAAGVAAGRLVFTADDPGATLRRLAAVVHDRTPAGVR